MTTQYTAFLRLPLPDFLTTPWQDSMEDSFRAIDAAIHNALVSSNTEVWANSTLYPIGQLVTSPTDGMLWVALVQHTSATTPTTFAADRLANPTYWQGIPTIPQQRGVWTTATDYIPGDFVVDSNRYAVALLGHTSGVFNTDLAAGKWSVLVDVSAAQPGINTTAEDAIPSSTTTDIGAEVGTRLLITGTATITSFGTVANTFKILRFNDVAKIIHNATTLVLLTGSSRTTRAGDIGMYASDSSGNWYEYFYSPEQATVVPQGRLTLSSGSPIPLSTISGATTLYYTPYVGNKITLYDGVKLYTKEFSEISCATTNTTNNPAAIGSAKVNDWFIWDDAGTDRLVHGPDWTNDTTRADALIRIGGIWLNNVAITNGPAIQRGTYVGTTRSGTAAGASATLTHQFGALAAGGTAGFFGVWNAYNRVRFSSVTKDSMNSWILSAVGAWTAYNSSTTNRCSIVVGLNEDAVSAKFTSLFACSFVVAGTHGAIGIGLDATNAFSGSPSGTTTATSTTGAATFEATVGIGFHFLQAIGYNSNAGENITFYGDAGLPAFVQSGLYVQFTA